MNLLSAEGYEGIVTSSSIMSTGDSFETRFEKIDNLLRDPKSEVNSDCLLVSAAVLFFVFFFLGCLGFLLIAVSLTATSLRCA